jgi:HD-GYP domain-containing protein (c-di-GMP phosphodiesterase class II)
LRAIDVAITTHHDLRDTLDVLLEQIMRQLKVDAAVVLLLNGDQLEYAASQGFYTPALQYTRLRPGEGNAGQAAQQRDVVRIPDLRSAPQSFVYAPLLGQEGFVSYHAAPLIVQNQVTGVLEVFHRSAFEPDDEWRAFLEALAGQAAIAIDNTALFTNLQQANAELSQSYDATIEGWSRALDLRDKETEGHTQRVTEMTLRLARVLGLPDEELIHLRRGALLHDIGKMGIPDSILLKPGPLTEAEWAIMRLHPVYANEMLAPIAYLRPALDIPYCHHEKWDGSGYPRGLTGAAIPLAARVFAVVDVWDALSSDRPYRQAWPREQVRDHLRSLAGSHFDPEVAGVFLKMLEDDHPRPSA